MTAAEIVVHRATLDDVDEAALLFSEYRHFYGRERDEEAAASFLRHRIRLSESVVLLARQAGKAVGFLQLYPGFSSISLAPQWILNDLFVDRAARRAGVAGALIDEAEKVAVGAGAGTLTLETAADNAGARRLYAERGYQLDDGFLHYAKSLR